MSVRSYSPGNRDKEVHTKRGTRKGQSFIEAENPKSKTQTRKRNLDAHKAGRRG